MSEQKVQTEVWAITEEGQVIEGLQKEKITKASQQDKQKKFTGLKTVDPRNSFDVLLSFLDENTWHKRCVLLKTALTGGLGWSLVTDDEEKKEDKDYKTIKAFLDNPNEEGQTFNEIIKRMLIDYYSTGNTWAEFVRNNKKEISEMYHMPVISMRRAKDFKSHWQVKTFSRNQFNNFGSDDISVGDKKKNEALHYFSYDPKSDYYGIPEWLPVIATMALDRAAVEYNTYEFSNGMMAKFIIMIEGGELSRKSRAQLKVFLQNNYRGHKHAGKAMVIANDDPGVSIKIERIDKEGSNKDISFSKSRTLNRDETIAAHNVPPRLVGIVASGSLGGTGEVDGQLKVFKEIVIAPEKEGFEEFLNRTVIASFADGKHKWKLKFNEMDISDRNSDAEYFKTMKEIGALLVDEVREEIGKQPLEEDQNKPTELTKRIASNLEATRLALEEAANQ